VRECGCTRARIKKIKKRERERERERAEGQFRDGLFSSARDLVLYDTDRMIERKGYKSEKAF
jgi:hypothetical protein